METADGYIFKMSRITNNPSGVSPNKGTKGPLILQHGATVPSEGWYFNGLVGFTKPYPQILFDAGYDVYLMEARSASPFSMGHSDPDKDVESFPEAYFDFDDSVIALNEVPAAVNKVLEIRAAETLECQKV